MPPLSRIVKTQLVVMLVLGLIAAVYAGVRYARVGESAGVGVYTVTLKAEESGGLFELAQVTYRGVPAGRVSDMRLTADGVEIDLRMQSGAGDIPADVRAVVANRSAIGEQYLDLQPRRTGGPYLHDGSVIASEDVVYPPELQNVLADTIDLTESVPLDDLRTVITELGDAFDGRAEDLTRLIDSLDKLAATGVEHLDETISLIENADVVLGTQAEQSDEILNWSRNLELVTAQLASSDPAVRRILADGQMTATELSKFLQQHGADATELLGQLGETVHTVEPVTFATGALFAMLSQLSAGSHASAPGDGQIHFGIVLETNNPPACTRGYESTAAMIAEIKKANPDFDIRNDDFPFNTEAKCTVPVGNPTGVRSANRAALMNPEFAQPWDGTPKKDADRLDLNPLATQLAALLGVHAR